MESAVCGCVHQAVRHSDGKIYGGEWIYGWIFHATWRYLQPVIEDVSMHNCSKELLNHLDWWMHQTGVW